MDTSANRYTEYQIANMNILNMVNWDVMHPDIVITMGGHRMLEFKPTFRKLKNKMEHWHVSPNGEVSDPYFCQTDIIECKQDFFFRRMSELAQKSNHSYYEEWATVEKRLLKQQPKAEDFEFSAVYAIKKLIENLPSKSLFHISNSDSIRISSSFLLPKNINVYCNRGTCGIDGSMSTYVAQSYVTNRPSFLVIGDLSFFYDMNGLWNHYINKNTRIMLINNGGGAILNFGAYKTVNVPNKLPNTAASHNVSAKGWVESIGFTYFAARTEEEFNSVMPKFVSSDSDTPILLEVYTKMDDDINERGKILSSYKSSSEQTKDSMKKIIAQPIKGILKGIVKRD